jgi:hypothetical protein
MASLEERISARLHQVLDQLAAAGMSAPSMERGLSVRGPDQPEILLSVADVARIAAQEVARPETDDFGAYDPSLGMVITEAGKARARAKLDAAAARFDPQARAELRTRLGLQAEPRRRREEP